MYHVHFKSTPNWRVLATRSSSMDRENFARFPYHQKHVSWKNHLCVFLKFLSAQDARCCDLRNVWLTTKNSFICISCGTLFNGRDSVMQCMSLKWIFKESKQFDWCLQHKDKIVTFQCDRDYIEQKFVKPNFFLKFGRAYQPILSTCIFTKQYTM